MKIVTTMTVLPINRIEGDPRNPNHCTPAILGKLKQNIAETGYYPPLVVRSHPKKPDYYQLIDGHHRLKVLEALNYQEVECQVLQLSDVQAQILLATLNRLRGEDNVRQRAELLDGLSKHIDIPALAQLVPENEAQIQDLLDMLKLEEVEMEVRFKETLEKEAEDLPVILSFVVSAMDAKVIQATIQAKIPVGSTDPTQGLLALCQLAEMKGEP